MFAGVLAPYSRTGITGKEYDPKTGLVFFGSRWYNPMVGQFTMPDTYMGQIKNPQSLKAYAYAWNNPVNRIDPTGHWVDNSDGTYTAESGDTLWGLAQETTGNGSNWTDIGYTGTPENLQVGETIGTSSGGTSSGDTASGGTSSGYDNGGNSGGGGGSYTPPPPPPEGGSISLPMIGNAPQGAGKAGEGFSSFSKLKNYLGSSGEGSEWHHIVEQSQIEKSGFSSSLINNTDNIIAIDTDTHRAMSGYYSSKPDFTDGVTVRNWLAGQSFDNQYEFGMNILRRFGVIK